MVGIKKFAFRLDDLTPSRLKELLKDHNTIEICSSGSREHTDAGLLKSKMLVRVFKKKNVEKLACPNCGTVLEKVVLLKANPKKETATQ